MMRSHAVCLLLALSVFMSGGARVKPRSEQEGQEDRVLSLPEHLQMSAEEGVCGRYNPFTYRHRGIEIPFDLTKGYTAGQEVTMDCPSGKKGKCTALCEEPGREGDGGWTFPESKCECAEEGVCGRYSTFTYRHRGITIPFDLAKGYTTGQEVTMDCPSGKKGKCTALCEEPGREG